MWRPSVSPSTRPSVCPVDRKQQRRAGGLLLSAVRAGDIGRQLRARCGKRAATCAGAQQQRRRSTALSSNGAAARRSAANAGSVTLTADEGG